MSMTLGRPLHYRSKRCVVPLIVLMIAALLIFAGCAAPQNAGQGSYALKSTYATGLRAAVEYKRLPSCAANPRPVPCSDAGVVKQLQDADDRAYSAIGKLDTGAIAFDEAKRLVEAFTQQAEKARAQ